MRHTLFIFIYFFNLAFSGDNIVSSDFYSIKFKNILGEDKSFKEFSGKKILVVNVASYCGYTKQYKDCLLYTSPSPRDQRGSGMASSA